MIDLHGSVLIHILSIICSSIFADQSNGHASATEKQPDHQAAKKSVCNIQ